MIFKYLAKKKKKKTTKATKDTNLSLYQSQGLQKIIEDQTTHSIIDINRGLTFLNIE